ncbi:hypothetical protein CBM2592_A170126 [Cupriavidus taiwanensis]|nr:hypothetical protein CBM2592_A170126 [Cupriavidus taiwanensis]SOY82667.1 hypothetical protein CBM2591_A210011 [Cupriavidus taiwanensis]SPA13194.1 hypothetical protein CBM2631_A190011 [Cupriavidus taiwanensis]SPD43801.1 protein of unknown function [Cupriavidus taiwanensis]
MRERGRGRGQAHGKQRDAARRADAGPFLRPSSVNGTGETTSAVLFGLRSCHARHLTASTRSAPGPAPRHRCPHPRAGARQLSRSRVAVGAPVLRPPAQPVLAAAGRADRRATAGAALCRTAGAAAGASHRRVGRAGRVPARRQPGQQYPLSPGQRFHAPARTGAGAAAHRLQRRHLRPLCAPVCRAGLRDRGAAIVQPGACRAQLRAEAGAVARPAGLKPLATAWMYRILLPGSDAFRIAVGHRAPILESGRPMIPDREYRPLLVRLAGSHFLTHGANASGSE